MGEDLEAKALLRNARDLDGEEDQWLNELVPDNQLRPTPKPSLSFAWEIRLEEQEFIKWRSSLEDHCLFFDGASKGNPGVVGGGGVIISSNGSRAINLSWGLGQETNNKEEALAP